MNLYIYTDESGVFDYIHNDYFVFGGVLYLSKEDRDLDVRKYLKVERDLVYKYEKDVELKASYISNKDKGKIFRSLNNTFKFGAVIKQSDVLKNIYDNKKSKQRYLDYVYKIALKRTLIHLNRRQLIDLDSIEHIHIYCDEHTTATDGKYELREAILYEFKHGTFNYNYQIFYSPICCNLKDVKLEFCDSRRKPLIRAADIVANKVFYSARSNEISKIRKKVHLVLFP